ncbi:MAG: hypothetical protein JWM11_5028 [Planctomycetaceae bacterium]|nr:hypothetical protein [Planctomycetaceae bacterium]
MRDVKDRHVTDGSLVGPTFLSVVLELMDISPSSYNQTGTSFLQVINVCSSINKPVTVDTSVLAANNIRLMPDVC